MTVEPEHTLFSIQQGAAPVRGADLEGRWNIGSGLGLYGAYTWTDTAALDKRVALVPKQSASIGADYTFNHGALSGFGIGAVFAMSAASTATSTTSVLPQTTHCSISPCITTADLGARS